MNPVHPQPESCDETRNDLDAFVDNQLGAERAAAVQEHLECCEACQAACEELVSLDHALRDSLATAMGDRVAKAESIAAQFESMAIIEPHQNDRRPAALRRLLSVVAVAIALLVFASPLSQLWPLRPYGQNGAVPAAPPAVGHVVAATGPFQVHTEQSGWTAHGRDSLPVALPIGARLISEDATYELETATNQVVRVDVDSEVVLQDDRSLQVVRGRAWCRNFEDVLTVSLIEPSGGAVRSYVCPTGSELQFYASGSESECVSMGDSVVDLRSDHWTCSVSPGESVGLFAEDPMPVKKVIADQKTWQLPLLYSRGDVRRGELHSVLEGVLEQIGLAKASFLYERQIEALGPRGADPLLAYALSPESVKRKYVRRRAARIGCSMADRRLLNELRQLATDEDEQVRSEALAAIQRLDG